MPENTVKVDRTTKWGNPFRVGDTYDVSEDDGLSSTGETVTIQDAADAVEAFKSWVDCAGWTHTELNLDELRGKNLACWCPLGSPCHADVLLELANQTEDNPNEG